MKKVYQTPESEVIPIKVCDILTNSVEKMNVIDGSWDEEEE